MKRVIWILVGAAVLMVVYLMLFAPAGDAPSLGAVVQSSPQR